MDKAAVIRMIGEREAEKVFFPRIGDAELVQLASDHPPLARECSGCAYRDGTEASSTASTIMARDTCDRTGHPFWCHMHKDELGFAKHLCKGWVDRRGIELAKGDSHG